MANANENAPTYTGAPVLAAAGLAVTAALVLRGGGSVAATISIPIGEFTVPATGFEEGRRYKMAFKQYQRYGDRKAAIEADRSSLMGPERQITRTRFDVSPARTVINVETTFADTNGVVLSVLHQPRPRF